MSTSKFRIAGLLSLVWLLGACADANPVPTQATGPTLEVATVTDAWSFVPLDTATHTVADSDTGRVYPSLKIDSEVVAEEDHFTVYPSAITRALIRPLPGHGAYSSG